MLEIIETIAYWRWFESLRDPQARFRVETRLRRVQRGNPGDFRAVGGGVLELRIDYGPGYRVYLMRRGITVIVLLAGGDKSSQRADTERAKRLAQAVQEERPWRE